MRQTGGDIVYKQNPERKFAELTKTAFRVSVLKGFSSAFAKLHAPKLSDSKQELMRILPALCPLCSVSQVVKTPPFHGSNTGSTPVPSTNDAVVVQLVEHPK